jgi:hypothetical protein
VELDRNPAARTQGAFFSVDLQTGRSTDRRLGANCSFLAVGPDDRLAVVHLPGQGGLAVTDLTGAKTYHRISGYSQSADFSPDGHLLAVAHLEDLVRVIELASGRDRFLFGGHRWLVGRVAFSPNGRRLASTSGDKTVLVWDTTTPLTALPATPAAAWAALADPDAGKGFAAIRYFADRPDALRQFPLEPARAIEAKELAGLVEKLDAPVFADREAASAKLAEVVDGNRPALRTLHRQSNSAEVRLRLDKLLQAEDGPVVGDLLRAVRAVEAWERIGSPIAVDVLQKLAGGAVDARLTREASGAIARLKRAK